jgi:UDP-N-acetylglucosamine 2-epimerase (non-hydrolysing)
VNSDPLKLLFVAGARPNFMKVAPLIKAAQARNASARNGERKLEWRLVHTGQHYDRQMSQIFFEELEIPQPDVNLEVGSGSHAQQTASIMSKFEPVLLEQRPDWVIVVGDVNSTLACTLVACKLGAKVAHVEAGLRSFDRTMPEELNRLATDALADLLLTPSEDANENLRREGIPEERIRLVGNVMIDSLVANLPKARRSVIMTRLGVEPKRFAYVTLHRPSNVDHRETLGWLMTELQRLAKQLPVVFAVHPRTRKMLSEFRFGLSGSQGLLLVDPIGYHDSLSLTENARLVLTDSGGLQEETTYFRTPCLTLRSNTERPVTVALGSNRLTSIDRVASDIEDVLARPARFGQVPPLWDGATADRTLAGLIERSRA